MPWYPPLARAPVRAGTKAVTLGRLRDGRTSYAQLFFKDITLNPSAETPFFYVSELVIEPGDSGGPVYVGTGAARTIVAVNSAGRDDWQVLARVDLVRDKIKDVIARSGGGGNPDWMN